MSGILKKIGKVFKKIVSSKIFKVVLIAAAVYFTAGVALAAGGSAFAASLPGITAAGQAVGLAGTGAIAATTAAEVASAAAVSAGVMTGSADLAATGLATAGIEGTIASTAAGSAATGALGDAALSALEVEAGTSGTGALSATATEAAGGAGSTFGGTAGAGTNAAVSGAKAAATAGKAAADASWGSNLMTWMDKNPTVAKAAMTFGSEGLKTGVNMFAQKSNQDAAEERYNQDREDYVRRSSTPTMTMPKPAVSQYATGLVNEVAGLKS